MTGNVNYGLGHLHTANFYPMKTLGDCKLWGPCRENLHYLWKRVVRIARKSYDNCRTSANWKFSVDKNAMRN